MRIFQVPVYILAVVATGVVSYKASAAGFNHSTELEVSNGTILNKTAKSPTLQGHPYSGKLTQATLFSDLEGNWAQSFIATLAAQGIIQGFPDGSFRPDEPVTRAQFAAMISKAFAKNPTREAVSFVDVPENYWATEAIQSAYQTGFLAGYPNNTFVPDQNIPRVQALVSLANGLALSAKAESAGVLNASFQDAAQIPEFARTPVAAATENQLVVSYPDVALLNPNQVATRADVAAFIYQALVSTGQVPQLNATDAAAQYIVGYEPSAKAPRAEALPAPTPEQVAQLRQQFLLPEAQLEALLRPPIRGGGVTINTPTAFGADWGDGFVGVSFQERTRFSDKSDGGVGFGFGLGDAQRSVGLEVAVSVVDLIGDTFEDGTVSFKIHRLLPNNFAVALGFENAIRWGSPDGGSSIYGVASKIFPLRENQADLFSRLTVSLGLGSDRFLSEEDREDGVDSVNVFGSAALQVIEPVSFIADWTGQDLYLGASIAPFQGVPLFITPGVADITGNAGDGARFILGVGYGISF